MCWWVNGGSLQPLWFRAVTDMSVVRPRPNAISHLRKARSMLGPPPLGMLGKVLTGLLLTLITGRFGIGIIAWRAANKLERPQYDVVRRLPGGIELRRYEPYLIAETVIPSGDMREASGKGFRNVAGYIFGKNKPKAKMDMTAPVRMTASGGEQMAMTAPVRSAVGARKGQTKVSFVLGSKYSKRSAPMPLNSDVRVRDVEPHTLAVRAFSGKPPSQARVDKERQKILAALEAEGLKAIGSGDEQTLVYGYHDPFITPAFLRRNEVCVRVASAGA